jgi:hypothetical protein
MEQLLDAYQILLSDPELLRDFFSGGFARRRFLYGYFFLHYFLYFFSGLLGLSYWRSWRFSWLCVRA